MTFSQFRCGYKEPDSLNPKLLWKLMGAVPGDQKETKREKKVKEEK
jgi:hypothetical protein